MKRVWISMFIATLVLVGYCPAEAGFLYHATKRAAAEKIARSGFSKAFMNSKARFGAMGYASSKPKYAIYERPGAEAVNRFRTPKNFNKHIMDTRKMSTAELKQASGLKDMRGTVKNKVIGPKLGHGLAQKAVNKNEVIAYKSAKNSHATNYALPERVYNNPRMFKPAGIFVSK